MPITRRPPVYLTRKRLSPRLPEIRMWVCDEARLRSARFEDRRRPAQTAVVHRSTKNPGMWQTSYFDERGASGDSQSRTCREAVRELHPANWRLRKLAPAR